MSKCDDESLKRNENDSRHHQAHGLITHCVISIQTQAQNPPLKRTGKPTNGSDEEANRLEREAFS